MRLQNSSKIRDYKEVQEKTYIKVPNKNNTLGQYMRLQRSSRKNLHKSSK